MVFIHGFHYQVCCSLSFHFRYFNNNYNSKNTISSKVTLKDPHILVLLSTYSSEFILECERNKNKNYFQINVDRFWNGRIQIVALHGTRSAVASGKSLYRVEMAVGSLSYARDLLRVERENPLVSLPILDPCSGVRVVLMLPDPSFLPCYIRRSREINTRRDGRCLLGNRPIYSLSASRALLRASTYKRCKPVSSAKLYRYYSIAMNFTYLNNTE